MADQVVVRRNEAKHHYELLVDGVEAGIFANPFANALSEFNHTQIIFLIRHLSFSCAGQ